MVNLRNHKLCPMKNAPSHSFRRKNARSSRRHGQGDHKKVLGLLRSAYKRPSRAPFTACTGFYFTFTIRELTPEPASSRETWFRGGPDGSKFALKLIERSVELKTDREPGGGGEFITAALRFVKIGDCVELQSI